MTLTLSKKDSSVKAAKILERMTRLCCIGPDECTVMDKLSDSRRNIES